MVIKTFKEETKKSKKIEKFLINEETVLKTQEKCETINEI